MVLDELLNQPPKFHTTPEGEAISWGASEDVLRFIDAHVGRGSRTLETGAGVSTVLFATKGCEHVCVTPAADELEKIKQFCAGHGISTDKVQFVAAKSEEALPNLDVDDLDLVLIDGLHSFPTPFIDWYYTAFRLSVGGVVIVDDLHLWTANVLSRFLRQQPGWSLASTFGGRSAAFIKTEDRELGNWMEQPFVARHSLPRRMLLMGRNAAGMVRRGELADLAEKANKKIRARTTRPVA